MIRALKIVGVVLSLAVGTSSAFSPPTVPVSRRSSVSSWGTSTSQLMAVSSQRADIVMMPATTEKESVKTSGPSVLERPATERKNSIDEAVKDKEKSGSEGWEVRIYNDGFNTREYVARSLVQITGIPEMTAYQTMMQAHQNGIAVVGTWAFEVAEMYHDSLRASGIVCDLVPIAEDN